MLESGLGHDAAAIAALLIVLAVNELAVIAATVPEVAAQHALALRLIALIAAATFAVEYALRLWSAVELPFLSERRGRLARLAYARRPLALIDLAAVISAIAGLVFPEPNRDRRLRPPARCVQPNIGFAILAPCMESRGRPWP
jgi:hypothetical protein